MLLPVIRSTLAGLASHLRFSIWIQYSIVAIPLSPYMPLGLPLYLHLASSSPQLDNTPVSCGTPNRLGRADRPAFEARMVAPLATALLVSVVPILLPGHRLG